MKRLATLMALAVVMVLAGCTTGKVEKLRDMEAYGSDFTRSLADQYRSFVIYKVDESSDLWDAHYFAEKGVTTARGRVLPPEDIKNWNIPADQVAIVEESRARLINAFIQDARAKAPQLAATAQAKFDCWVEELDEGKTGSELQCAQGFMMAMDQLEAALASGPKGEVVPWRIAEPQASPAAPAAPQEVEVEKYIVFFAFDSARIDGEGLEQIGQVIQEIRGADEVSLKLMGYADRSGPESYNEGLSKRRAMAVRAALVNNGITAERIMIEASGENHLPVPTADGVVEPQNRRVEIYIMAPEMDHSSMR